MHCFRFTIASLLIISGTLVARGQADFEQAPIRYHTSPVDDAIARLQQAIESDSEQLVWDDRNGWLSSVLEKLDVPQLGMRRVSLTPTALLNSAAVYLLFFGDEKRRVYESALAGRDVEILPVRVVLRQHRVRLVPSGFLPCAFSWVAFDNPKLSWIE